MNVVALVRVSSDQQDTVRQESDIKGYCLKSGDVIKEWFRDKESRDLPEMRPDFMRLIRAVESKRVGKIIIQEFNRFGCSDFIQFAHYAEIIRRNNVQLVSVAEGDLLTGEMSVQIMNMFRATSSSTEQHTKGRTSLDGKRQKVKDGAGPIGAPTLYGFDKACYSPAGELLWTFTTLTQQPISGVVRTYVSGKVVGQREVNGKDQTPRKSKGDRLEYVISHDTERAEVVQWIYATFTSQSISCQRIAHILNERGTTFYGKNWCPQTVETILRNEKYCGDWAAFKTSAGRFGEVKGGRVVPVDEDLRKRLQYEKPRQGKKRRIRRVNDQADWIVREATHQAIIDRETFAEAQSRLARRKPGATTNKGVSLPPRKSDHYLKGLLYCSGCEREMWVAKSGTQLRYECQTYSREYREKGANATKTCSRNLITHDEAVAIIRAKLAELKAVLNPTDPDTSLACVFAAIRPFVVDGTKTDYVPTTDPRIVMPVEAPYSWETPVNAPKDRAALLEFLRTRFPGKSTREVLEGLGIDPTQAAGNRAEEASAKVDELNTEFARWVNAKVHADSDEERAVISAKLKTIRAELEAAKEAATPPQTLLDVFLALQDAVTEVESGPEWADRVKGIFARVMVKVELKLHGQRGGKDLFRYVVKPSDFQFIPKPDVASSCSQTIGNLLRAELSV